MHVGQDTPITLGAVGTTCSAKGGFCCVISRDGNEDASTKRPLPVLILPFKTSLNDFIPDNHEFQVKITLV